MDTHSTEQENSMTATQVQTDAAAVATPIFQQLEDAWNAADGAAFGARFTDDADFVNVRGEHHRGAVAIGHGHQAIFDSIYKGSRVEYRPEAARTVAPGIIVALAGATLEVPAGPLAGVLEARMTVVIVERDGEPLVTAFHNTLVVDGGPPPRN
jgi:uncharacterized protein (TIGR02246 family)